MTTALAEHFTGWHCAGELLRAGLREPCVVGAIMAYFDVTEAEARRTVSAVITAGRVNDPMVR